MKKITFYIITALMAALLLSGCTGAIVTETREVSGFSAISISTFGEIEIRQGDTESLTISAPSDYMRYIETEVENGTLLISTRKGFIGAPTRRVEFILTVKDLKSLHFSGAGVIKVMDKLQTSTFSLNMSGAGSIEIEDLTADTLTVNFSSAGAIVIAGSVENQSVNLSGVGSYEAGDLQSKVASVNLSGAGSATIWAVDSLDVTVSGVGSVGYYGSPRVTQNVSGLGSVNSKGEHR